MIWAGTWVIFAVLAFIILIRVAPVFETAFFPCARGLAVSWRVAEDKRIHIQRALFWKSEVCVYRQMHARAGNQDLAIEFTQRLGNRAGGEFEARDIFIEQPFEPAPIQIKLTARHRWNPLWSSTSKLFVLDYPGR